MINIAILSTWMKKHKIGCTVAHNGQEAVERWQQGGFHLVLVRVNVIVYLKRRHHLTKVSCLDGSAITSDEWY